MSRQQIHILHVDDESDFADLTKTFLEREDDRFSVETAISPDEGLQLLAESEIDCVVSDYQMPGMNGIEFLKIVAEEYPTLPFILYTGQGSEEVASEAISAGVTDYLQKKSGPDNYALLANRIVNAVNSQRHERKIKFLQTLENELTELAIDFLRTDERDLDTLINDTLKKIGTLVDADRTYDFDIHHEAETLSNTYEWCMAGVDPQIHILQDIPQNTVPWWIQHLENFENITIPNVSELPPEAEAEQELLQEQNIESLIVTPMVSNDELVGFIGFDWVEKQEAWSDEFINVLRMVGELITTARERKEREQELQELKSQYETLAENFPDGAVFLIGTDLKCVRAGGEELSKAGLSPDDIEGAKPHDLFPEKIADELCHYYEEALDGNANTFEQVYGGERYRIQTFPVRTDGEDIDHVMAVSQNVTERVEDKQNLEALFESSPDMINIHTADGTIINVNQRFCEAFDQSKDELVGQKVWDIDQEIEPGELQDMWDGMDVGDRTELETEFQTKGGTRFPVEVHLTRLPVDSGTQFMVISRDITERKQRMQQIQALKERLELAVEGANLGVWDWDMATDEVEFNDQWAEMLGYTLEDIEPHLDAWKKRVHPDDIDEVKAALDAHIQQKTGYYDTEHRMRTADDEWKWIRDIGKIFERDANDDPVRAVGIHLNIDETKQYQRELEGKTERLEEFASIVSHDLRSPLSVAAGNLELARDDCESPHLENIERAHGRMSALIDDLLTLAREGEAVTDTEAVNLATVVRKCWDVVETTEASLTIENNRTVMADEPRLKQLFENLIRNAVEHGGSTVTVTVGGLQNGFYIEDDGPGIPEDDAEAVFEAGYSTNDKGTGFGLSIVQRIVEAHGWDIRITNSSKGGARFEITDVELITE